MRKYGLRHIATQKLLEIEVLTHSDDEAPIDKSYSLDIDRSSNKDEDFIENSIWLVSKKEQANFVRLYPQDMMSSQYICPEHDFKPSELEVVEVEIKVSESAVTVEPYTYEDFIKDLKKEEEAIIGLNSPALSRYERYLTPYFKDKETMTEDQLYKKYRVSHFQTPFDQNRRVLAKLKS